MLRILIVLSLLLLDQTAHAKQEVVAFDPFTVKVKKGAAAPVIKPSANIDAAISSYLPATGPGARDKVSSDAVKGFFKDILGRDPSAAEIAVQQAKFNSGIPLDQVRVEIAQSSEAKDRITDSFNRNLNRSPTDAELKYWSDELSRPGSSISAMSVNLAKAVSKVGEVGASAAASANANSNASPGALFGGPFLDANLPDATAGRACFEMLTLCSRKYCVDPNSQCEQCMPGYQACREYAAHR